MSHDQITVPLYSVCFKLILSHQNHFIENSMITETNDVKHSQLFIATAADIYIFCAVSYNGMWKTAIPPNIFLIKSIM